MDKMKKGILSDIIKEMSAIEAGDWKGKKNATMTVTIAQPSEESEVMPEEEVCEECGKSPCECE
jgi:hypothetical protein